MSSSRLPGKVLKTLCNGKTLIEILILRIQELRKQNIEIIVATSNDESDNILVDFLTNNFHWLKIFRGDLKNVMQRYYDAALSYEVEVIIRITSDCPFIDPKVISKMLNVFEDSNLDYLANTMPPEKSTFSDGFDVEIFRRDSLQKQMNLPELSVKDKEHVTFLFWNSLHFNIGQFKNTESPNFQFKLSVDNNDDFLMIDSIVKRIGYYNSYSEIEYFIEANEDIRNLNINSKKNSGWKV